MKTEVTTITADMAAEINRLHGIAVARAGEALQYAAEAGKLLLRVKASLPHGKFVAWIEKNVTVSVRQAQRYISVAQGKTQPVRSIAGKNDTVSLLAYPLMPDWLPSGSTLLYALLDEDSELLLQEDADNKDHYYVAYFDGMTVDFTVRPIIANFVEYAITGWLPGHYLRTRTIKELPWESWKTASPYWLRDTREDFLPEGYDHLRHKAQAH